MSKRIPGTEAAIHVLYREDFRSESMWEMILEMHGIYQSDEGDCDTIDEITIRATCIGYDTSTPLEERK